MQGGYARHAMKKIVAIAAREYAAAVKTKAFVISVLLLPVMLGLTVGLRRATDRLAKQQVRTFAVIDNVGDIYQPFATATPTPWKLELARAGDEVTLSQRVRAGALAGFITIDPTKLTLHSLGAGDLSFRGYAEKELNHLLRDHRLRAAGLDFETIEPLLATVPLTKGALVRLDANGKPILEPPTSDLASLGVPLALSIIMFMIVIVSAIPMMQGVIEEKQLRIAEVLLASVRPFELMTGKLLGMFAISATLIAIYAGGALIVSAPYLQTIGQSIPATTIGWFILFQILAVLMFGSMYIAIGASCSDMRQAQALLLPLNLLIMLPLLLLGNVVEHPDSALARWASFVPTAAPFLTIARIAMPPGIPLWETILSALIVVLTTMLFVWAAGRIFRIGMMAGGSINWMTLLRWIVK
ncbi:MAG: ABC transporter permease [Phycisphaerae bacterium]|nr:ABC transporter permease [Phycisphaerae bacterium]